MSAFFCCPSPVGSLSPMSYSHGLDTTHLLNSLTHAHCFRPFRIMHCICICIALSLLSCWAQCGRAEVRLMSSAQDYSLFPIPYSIFRGSQVVSRPSESRADARNARIRRYFYGPRRSLFPCTFELKFSEVKLFRLGGTG